VTRELPERVIAPFLESGERTLWSGRPETEAAVAHAIAFRVASPIVALVAFGAGLFAVRQYIGWDRVLEAVDGVRSQPQFLVPIGVIFVFPIVIRLLKLDNRSRLRRYFDSMTYAITDRRLIIVESGEATSYRVHELATVTLRKRARGVADVIFAMGPSGRSSTGKGDIISRERRNVGFKALRQADEVRRNIEEWIEHRLQVAAAEVAVFAESAAASDGWGPGEGVHRIENRRAGFRVDAPDSWSVEVREKKKPFGKTFFDKDDWRPLTEGGDWNTVRISGPAACAIEIEVFETQPTVTYKALAESGIAETFGGKAIATDPDLALNGLHGFSVTRRNEIGMNAETNRAQAVASVMPQRQIVVRDGRRQVYMTSTWPEDSPELAEAVDLVVQSFKFG